MNKNHYVHDAIEALKILLKPVLVDPTSAEYAETQIDVSCWPYENGGVRIAEIAGTYKNGGWAYMRGDFLYEEQSTLHRLFMLCEEWIVLTAFSDEAEDLPQLEAAIKSWGEPKKDESIGPKVHVYSLKIISKNGIPDHVLGQRLLDDLDAMLPPKCRFVIEDENGTLEPAENYGMEEIS